MARRELLQRGGIYPLGALPLFAQAVSLQALPESSQRAADHAIRIGNGLLNWHQTRIIFTRPTTGSFPVPLLRLRRSAGRCRYPITTPIPRNSAWRQTIPVDVDGASEERHSLYSGRMACGASPSARAGRMRFYHTHITPGAICPGPICGQVGTV